MKKHHHEERVRRKIKRPKDMATKKPS